MSVEGWTYGDAPKTPSVTGNYGNSEVTYEYKASGAADGAYSQTVPTGAGDYTVRVTAAKTANTKAASKTVIVTVKVTGKLKAASLKAQSARPTARPAGALKAAAL